MIIPENGESINVELVSVKSTMLESFGYDEKTRTLYARFLHGHRLYAYPNVPADMAELMRKSQSPGKYLSTKIIGGGYAGKFVAEIK